MGLKHLGRILHPAGVTQHSSGDSLGKRETIFRDKRERGMFESTENCVYDQATAIGNDDWLSELKNHVEGES